MDKLGASPDECVMVGDTSNDFNAASQNGVDSIGVSWGYGTEEELNLASRIVNSSEEIV